MNLRPINAGIVLSLCDLSGEWPRPWREAGYDVVQVDLQRGGDVRLFERPSAPVLGILAAPPCTMFASSGARWKRSDDDMREALAVVDACLRLVTVCRPRWWALENPVGTLVRWLGKPRCYFNPCDYGGYLSPPGDAYTKRTALWGGLPNPDAAPCRTRRRLEDVGAVRREEHRHEKRA